MNKDFYLNDRSLASYVEKDWFDHIHNSNPAAKDRFTFAPFAPLDLYSKYHEDLAAFITGEIPQHAQRPRRFLEIGSSLGRSFYELCLRLESLEAATLVEPSANLFHVFQQIFSGGPRESLPILKGNIEIASAALDTVPIQSACEKVNLNCLNSTFQDLPPDLGQYDLVLCSNVIDQCHDPLKLVELLKSSTAAGGLLVLSCTYQWQSKYIGNAGHQIKNINGLLGEGWRHLNETNIPFQCRVYERHWITFLSHVSVFQKL